MSEEKGEGYLDVGGSESEEVRLAATYSKLAVVYCNCPSVAMSPL